MERIGDSVGGGLSVGRATVGDRVQFGIAVNGPDGKPVSVLQGDGYVVFVAAGDDPKPTDLACVAVLGYPGVQNIPMGALSVIERGALLRHVQLR